MNKRIIRRSAIAATGVLSLVALSACSAAETGGSKGGDKTVRLHTPSWVGAEVNTAVAKELLESELGYKVETKQMDETPAWDAMSQGKIDAILEDWGHPEEVKRYVDGNKTVVAAGDLGVVGHIGWFVPKYVVDENPDITDYKNLNKYADLFKTPESGDKGQFIKGDPSYVSNDNALIKNLKLNYQPIEAGAEATHLAQLEQLYKAKKPFLTYWWTPQWMNATIDLVEVKLPEYKEGCDADENKVACAYPEVPLKKWMNADFAKEDSDAAKFLKNFNWSTEDQNLVAKYVAQDKMSSQDAAKKWIADNEDKWKAWLPK
ncbi:ABC transporter substrate-binding protein [Streptomyces sp. HNM0663]|uniref:ABC transporter substrate-binding protein n=1 Tax=Streptomyces chengmaiensis TaxID=3040919 RepID=A0ABT6HSX0_9ACTN|nr:ABC transporter substrate-binding protein [Streptomyces chengmaiensis]MDH2391813.1 ABC transporter substrate-binding protein [Streptomyces chengmaiensis]